ncbi:helix-hairpin-helix domain-containing protein [Bacillus sp. 37MA]|uniref:helix-hairpin-helix domain-containing protein n=1 Tax=Bacillus sp. 37MA TaxID=1132442 RepID=UPI000374ED50|nr:helix-hairpin-helix domain-containing protein [Bacillus sp. 37MA]
MKQLIHKYKIPAAGGLAVFMFWLYGLMEEETVPPEPALVEEAPVEVVPEEISTEEAVPVEVAIDVKGAVTMPGIYMMTSDQRVNDAINKAGGLTETADAAAVNLAQKVQDEMVIYVPTKGEGVPPVIASSTPGGNGAASAKSSESAEGTLININEADSSGLQKLPGVGEAKAQAIIDYRETEGPFAAAEELKNVSGIGDKTFEKLEPLITVQ